MRNLYLPGLNVVLVATLVLSGCFSAMQGPPPENPDALDYLVTVESGRAAPHAVTFGGSYALLHLDQFHVNLTPSGTVEVRSWNTLPPMDLPEDVKRESARSPPGPPPTIVLWNASGQFTYKNGTQATLRGETVELRSSASFDLAGVERVQTQSVSFEDERARIRVDPLPAQIDPPASENLLVFGSSGAISGVNLAVRESSNVSDGEGTLNLVAGNYRFSGTVLEFTPSSTVSFRGGLGVVEVRKPGEPIGLYGESHTFERVRLVSSNASGIVLPRANEANFTAEAIQWWSEGRPWFESSVDASLVGAHGSSNMTIRMEPGDEKLLWLGAHEISGTSTAPRLRPVLNATGLNASFGTQWYASSNVSSAGRLLSEIASAWALGLIDLSSTTLEPLEDKFIPLWVGVPEDVGVDAGEVQAWVHGENARSAPVTVHVEVVAD